jgi:glycosyltransferase involved in cell wall biosynthesis
LAHEFPHDRYWLLSDQPFPDLLEGAPPNLFRGSNPLNPITRKWWLVGLDREMARHGVELFHGTDFAVPYIARRPSVLTLHDLSPWVCGEDASPRVRRRTPLQLRMGMATMIITPTQAIRRAAISHFSLDPERVAVVPHAASKTFRPVDVPPSQPYFLFVGTLEQRKNVTRLIDAWREVRKTHAVDLVLAGRVRDGFPAPAAEPGLRVLGAVPEHDLPGLYSGALAFVYPSAYEGFGLPVLEAMQCGAAVITSQDPALVEVSGDAAIHVDANDIGALAEAMTAVARSPANFSEMRQRALARARELTWQRTARRTREVYDAARRIFERS